MKTIRISDIAHEALTRVKGQLTMRNGKGKTYSETITELIKFWNEKKE